MLSRRIESLIWLVAVCSASFSPPGLAQSVSPQGTDEGQRVLHEIVSQYFPSGSFPPSGSTDEQLKERATWLALYLRSIGEPPLAKSAADSEVHAYRLIWIGFPSGKIFVLRLQLQNDGSAKVFVKQTAYSETNILLNQERSVSKEAVNGFLECVKKSDFWQLASLEIPEPRMSDGSYWYLEGVSRGHYHMVYRRTPELNPGPFTDIGRYLAKKLAQLDDSTIRIPRGDSSEPLRRAGPSKSLGR